jgi:hypothetical protein
MACRLIRPNAKKPCKALWPCRDLITQLNDKWCRLEDLNPQPTDYKSVALPVELSRLIRNGADEGIRTPDLRITNALLYQLSYISKSFIRIVISEAKVKD